MTRDELLEAVRTRVPEQTRRAVQAAERIRDGRWEDHPIPGEWSVPQVFHHLTLANAPYFEGMRSALASAGPGPNAEVRFTWFGTFIRKAAGPGGNAPPPKALIPSKDPIGREVVEVWRGQQDELLRLADLAAGAEFSRARFRNPFVRLFRMSLGDGFAIVLDHTERHVRQIEERAALLL